MLNTFEITHYTGQCYWPGVNVFTLAYGESLRGSVTFIFEPAIWFLNATHFLISYNDHFFYDNFTI